MTNLNPAELAPTVLVIFGITGDLARRKLLPALYHLSQDQLLPSEFKIIGVSRRQIDIDQILSQVKDQLTARKVEYDPAAMDRLGKLIQPLKLNIAEPTEYNKLMHLLLELEDQKKLCYNRLFYLSIPPQVIGPVVDYLGQSDLNQSCRHGRAQSRLLIEKPFGYDLESARELIERLNHHFRENQIYRIDHYLAKETVQNILTFRSQNPLFEGLWSGQFIDHIMVTVAETIGIENRVQLYEQIGALRDMIQSHLLQLLTLTMMELPDSSDQSSIHHKKLELLQAIKRVRPDQIDAVAVRGQYAGYRDEVQNPDSTTETFAALKLEVDSPRWRDVPVLLRTGKCLAEKVTEINLVFRTKQTTLNANTLTIRIQPDEGIALELTAKKPGFTTETQAVQMDFCYSHNFDKIHPDDYERIFIDAVRGDQTLFSTSEEVLAAWELLDPIVRHWSDNVDGLEVYQPGSWGPKRADELAKSADAKWTTHQLKICSVHLV